MHLASMAASSPFYASPVVDAHTYTVQARTIAAGAWLDFTQGAFWQPPLYPWLLGAVSALWPESFFVAARVLQAGLGAMSCVLLFVIGRRLCGAAGGFAAALALALYGPAIYFDAELLPATLGLLLPLLLFVSLPDTASSWWRWLGVGVVLGVGAIGVPTILALTPCLVLWLLTRRYERPVAARAGRLAAVAAGVLLVVAPVGARNFVFGGDAVLISWNGGVNFYLGNNPDYPATTHIRPGQPWLDLMANAAAAGQGSGSANSRFFYAAALDFIRADPGQWSRQVGDKMRRLLHGEEIGRNQSPYLARRDSPLLATLMWRRLLWFPFGLVAPLAVVGVGVALTRPGRRRLVAGFILSYGAGLVLFFVTSRYRLPIVPFALLAAVLGLVALGRATRARRRAAIAGWVLVFGLTVAVNAGRVDADVDWEREALFALGQAQVDSGRLSGAAESFQRAARGAEDDPDILFSLGTVYLLGGDFERAVPPLERVTSLRPGRPDARLNLGNALFGCQRYAGALEQYRAGLRILPRDPVLTRGAARAAARSGALREAIDHYRRWHEAAPEALEPCLALGYSYANTAMPDSALHFYEHALVLEPTHLTALLEAALLLMDRGQLAAAGKHLDLAARRYPGVSRTDTLRARLERRPERDTPPRQ